MNESKSANWCNGTPIDIAGVPLKLAIKKLLAPGVIQIWEAANGGQFEAIYIYEGSKHPGIYIYKFSEVAEVVPPSPPQIQGFGDNVRLHMPTVAEEITQRKKEWSQVSKND